MIYIPNVWLKSYPKRLLLPNQGSKAVTKWIWSVNKNPIFFCQNKKVRLNTNVFLLPDLLLSSSSCKCMTFFNVRQKSSAVQWLGC
jgi:hypothetical protein